MATKPRLAILLNSPATGVLGPRADALSRGLSNSFDSEVLRRNGPRAGAIPLFLAGLRRARPDIVYVIDLGYPVVAAAMLYQTVTRCPLIVEIGDPLGELLWATGRVGAVGRWALRGYERVALKRADHVVVRGTGLKSYVERLGVRRVTVVPDGVDTQLFQPMDVEPLRRDLGLEQCLTLGVMGSLNWSERLAWGYGAELVEVLRVLEGLPVRGIVLGDGPGRGKLEEVAKRAGVWERIRFLGHRPFEELPALINAMDVCFSTQTNDTIGRGRTTAKLPLFLACARFVLASRVGEAERVLPEQMLVEYREGLDRGYTDRLAARVSRLLKEPQLLDLGTQGRRIAEAEFDYRILVPRVATVIHSVLQQQGAA